MAKISPTYETAMRAPVGPIREITARSVADNYAAFYPDYNDRMAEWDAADAIVAKKANEVEQGRGKIEVTVASDRGSQTATATSSDRPNVDVVTMR